MAVYSFSPFGYEGALVAVEVDLRRGIPAVDIVGLADSAVKESRERMRAAIQNSGFEFPPERVLISLSPADVKKEGAGFDLAVALAVLMAREGKAANPCEEGGDILVMGELELSGKVRPVRAVHAAASTAASGGITRCIVPAANVGEAREVPGMRVFGAATLEDAFAALEDTSLFTERDASDDSAFVPDGCVDIGGVLFPPAQRELEFADIKGQAALVRALQIAAAGAHNVIAVGAPGCGKTMAMQKFPALLPLLTAEEARSVTRVHSLAGLIQADEPLVRIAPFRAPHQTSTIEGMCGGGQRCAPGEISLAHNGALFLDEASEFRATVLQMLRVPMESGRITLARAGRTTVYPASFQLLMAANPCPCGNYGSRSKICLCSARAVELYWKKFSMPLLDRIDLRVHVQNERGEKDAWNESDEESTRTADLREGVARAVLAQRERQGCRNSKLCPQDMAKFCRMESGAKKLLDDAAKRHAFSPRAVSSAIRVARTIADMDGCASIRDEHMAEAVSFRKALSDFLPEIGE